MKIKDLRKFRKSVGLTIYEIAELTGLSYTSISRIESGVMGVSIQSAKKLAPVYELPLEAFLDTVDHLRDKHDNPGKYPDLTEEDHEY